MSAAAVLDVQNIVKNFGALRATDHVSLQVFPGEVHALIGPNGAGKTSLVAQISGLLKSDSGEVFFRGENITALTTHQRVARGLVRSFQITRLFKSFTALENVALAVQSRSPSPGSMWRLVQNDSHIVAQAHQVLTDVGLAQRANDMAMSLSHGEQRVLELAVALATQPTLLLLDEPMAGTGPDESQRIVDLIARLKQTIPVLLVEHDMDAVFRLADRISVLVNGAVIACADPQSIRHNPQVVAAYLGDEVPA